jgi:glutamate synthase (NADPH/NADH) small chain
MELIESCNPLPNVTGRVCPQELQCQGVCAHTKQPIEIGQLEWFLPQREKVVNPDGIAERFAGVPDPWERAVKPPIAIVGSGPAGLINAYLLAAEGFPVTVFEAFHALGGVLRYGIPEFRLPNADRRRGRQDQAARRQVRAELRRRQDGDAAGPARTPASGRSSSAPAPGCRAS